MRRKILSILILAGMGLSVAIQNAPGQWRRDVDPELIAKRNAIENELQSVAIVERKVMVPMRDGKRMAADVYRPKDTSKKYPASSCALHTSSFLDVRTVCRALDQDSAVKRGTLLSR